MGGKCIIAECYKCGGENYYNTYKKHLIDEFNALGIIDMPSITTLFQLNGKFINLEYTLQNGEKIKFFDDTKIYMGNQVKKTNSNRYYGLVADNNYLLVCEYDYNGTNPEIIVFKKRKTIPILQN